MQEKKLIGHKADYHLCDMLGSTWLTPISGNGYSLPPPLHMLLSLSEEVILL